MKQLSGKTALVTGGSRGIGAAIARRLAVEGADVAFSYLASLASAGTVVNSIESEGARGMAIKTDQGDVADVERLIAATYERFSRLDILVLNAGLSLTGAVDDADPDVPGFDRQFAVNVSGAVAAVRAASHLLTAGGRIISIGTVFATRTPLAGFSDYAASKAAVAAYTHGWARDLGPRGITVNIVQPGPIDTEMNPETSAHAPVLSGMTALGRYGRVEEVAAVVAFLAGPEASYVTGTTINVDGGFLA